MDAGNPPPAHIYLVPRKMFKAKSCNFLLFLNMWMDYVLETTFCSQLTFDLELKIQQFDLDEGDVGWKINAGQLW